MSDFRVFIEQMGMLGEARRAFRTSAVVDEDTRSPAERWPDLVIGGEFSEKLMKTYNAVIFGIAIFVGIVHWSSQLRSWWRRREAAKAFDESKTLDGVRILETRNYGTATESTSMAKGASSSGSSTLDVGTPPETVKLLGDEQESQESLSSFLCTRGSPLSTLNSIRGWLAYQPKPIPFFNKTLPSNGATLASTLFVLLNFFYLFVGMKWRILYVVVFGDRCALVFIYNLPLLYLLAAKTQPLSFFTGYSYESLNIIHRRLGEVMCLCGLLHSIFMFLSYVTFLSTVGFTLYTFIFNQTVLTGIALFVSYETIYFTSLASFRQRWYEIFLATHVILQAATLALLYFHHRNNGTLTGIALLIFVVDRVAYRIGMKSTAINSEVTVAKDGETVILKSSIPYRRPGLWASTLGHQITHGWQPTDHVFLTAPSLGRSHALQAHPFTILSPSPWSLKESLGEGDMMQLDLLVRAYDGFTSDLLKHSLMSKSLRIRIDGPYGGCHARDAVEDKDQAILIAGGSGIAVIWPIVHFLIAEGHKAQDVESTPAVMPKQRIVFIWVVQQRSQLSWMSEKELEELSNAGIEVLIPPPTREVFCRPDLPQIITERVAKCSGKTGVVASGPDSMGRDVRNACASLIRQGKDVNITIEKFGW